MSKAARGRRLAEQGARGRAHDEGRTRANENEHTTADEGESYADRLRRQEHEMRCKRGRYTRRELGQMHGQAEALIHLALTGWLPERKGPRDDYFRGRRAA